MDQETVTQIFEPIRQVAHDLSLKKDFKTAYNHLKVEFEKSKLMGQPRVRGYYFNALAKIYEYHELYEKSIEASLQSADEYRISGDNYESAKSKILVVRLLG